MGGDRLDAYRITDYMIPMLISSNPEIREAIYEDNSDHNIIPNIIDDYYIGVRLNGYTFSFSQIHSISMTTWQIHPRVLPEYRRKYSRKVAELTLKWCANHIVGLNTIICMVPKCNRDVALYARRVGFDYQGSIPDAWFKNGKLEDLYVFSINVAKIRSLEV